MTLAWGGQSQVVVGSASVASATATTGGSPVAGAHFSFTSSDTSVLVVVGDTLIGQRLGSATVTATLTSSLVGGSPPSVAQAVAVVPLAVVLDSASVTFRSLGDTLSMGVTVLAADSAAVAGAVVTWTSLDTTKVAVSPQGRLLARATGSTGVIAAAGGRADTVSVTVTQVLVHYAFAAPLVTFNALTAVQTVTATPRDARGNTIASGAAPTYQVRDQSVATVNAATGALSSAFNGTTFLLATRGTVNDSVQVTVAQKARLVAIAPKPVPALTSLSDTRQLSASAVDSLNVPIAAAQPVWIPLSSICSITQTGLVTALATGSAYVVATLDGRRDSVLVTITNDPGSIRVLPDTATATSLGDTLIYQAVVRNLRGDSIGVLPAWRTPDTSVVSIRNDTVVAKKVGTARIIAQAGSKADTAIAVVTNVPASINIVPVARTLTALSDVDTPSVSVLNARGATLDPNAVAWTSDDASIARVNARGIVTAVDTGTTVIRACYPASCIVLQDSVVYTVQNVPTSVGIVLPPRGSSGAGFKRDTLTAIGQSLTFGVNVLNHRGAAIANYPVAWVSTVTGVVDSVRANAAVAQGFGTTKLIATAGTVADTLTLVVANLTRIVVDNSVVANPRVGTLSRPFLHIQDAVAAADANDTVLVRRGSGPYAETVALNKRLFLLGDSTAYVSVSGGRNPTLLPLIGHDTGAAAVTAFTSAPQTIKYLTIRHTLDGPALDANGSDVSIDNVFVNPSGLTPTRIGRGLSIKNSVSGTRITNSTVDSVRGYGVRLEAVSNATVHVVTVVGVDSLPGLEEGAGIKLVSGNADVVSINFVRNAQIGVLVTGATSARVDSNVVWRNLNGLRITGGTTTQVTFDDIFDNTADTLPVGVVNPGGAGLTMANAWWGDSLGPRQNSIPLATGDSVVGNVTTGTFRARPFIPGGAAAALRIVRGNNQTRSKGNPLNQALAVRVVDAAGLPVTGGVSVTFATASGGSFSPSATVTSNSSGLAEVTYTLSSTPGVNTVTATITVNGSPVSVTFTETGT